MQGGHTLELCMTQYWSELSPLTASLTLKFHSLRPSSTSLFLVSKNFYDYLYMHATCVIYYFDPSVIVYYIYQGFVCLLNFSLQSFAVMHSLMFVCTCAFLQSKRVDNNVGMFQNGSGSTGCVVWLFLSRFSVQQC